MYTLTRTFYSRKFIEISIDENNEEQDASLSNRPICSIVDHFLLVAGIRGARRRGKYVVSRRCSHM